MILVQTPLLPNYIGYLIIRIFTLYLLHMVIRHDTRCDIHSVEARELCPPDQLVGDNQEDIYDNPNIADHKVLRVESVYKAIKS